MSPTRRKNAASGQWQWTEAARETKAHVKRLLRKLYSGMEPGAAPTWGRGSTNEPSPPLWHATEYDHYRHVCDRCEIAIPFLVAGRCHLGYLEIRAARGRQWYATTVKNVLHRTVVEGVREAA